MECPMLEDPRLGQFQVFRNLNGQTVMLPEYQTIEYYIRFQMIESGKLNQFRSILIFMIFFSDYLLLVG